MADPNDLDRLGMPFKNGHVLEFTATFHSYRVNHSSNPKGGATTFLPQLRASVLLTAAPRVSLARIPNIPIVFPRRAFSPVGREASGGPSSTPRVEAEPHVFTCEFSGFSG